MNIKNILRTPATSRVHALQTITPARAARHTLRWVIAGLFCALATSSYAQFEAQLYATPAIGASAGGAWRDNNTGGIGCGFTVGSTNVVVSHLGVFSTNKVAGLSASYYVGVYAGTSSSHTLLGQVIVPSGTSPYYTNTFYWMPLNPPLLLKASTLYWLESVSFSYTHPVPDWFGDNFTPTWGPYFVGSTSTSGGSATYGGGSPNNYTWPLAGTFTKNGANKTYCWANLANIQVGPPSVGVQQTNAVIGPCQSSPTNVVLNGFASGAVPLGYQWCYNGSPMSDGTNADQSVIAGSSTATLTISNYSSAEAGAYCLVATNYVGTNQSANVPVVWGFGVTQPPTNITVAQGYTATFYSPAIGVPPISYQWYSNGVAVAGATSSTFSETAQMANNGDTYSCFVSNYVCSTANTASNSATLTVLPNVAPSTQQFLHGFWPSLDNNTGTGQGGGQFTVGNNNVTVTYLGYYAWPANTTVTGNTTNCTLAVNHHIGIYTANSSTLLTNVVIPAGVNPVINGYMWQPLNPPFVLTNKTTYMLMAEQVANVDPEGDTYSLPDLNSAIASTCWACYSGNAWGTSPGVYGQYGGQMYSGPNLAILETGNPAVFILPATIAQVANTAASLSATLDGQPPLTLQWYQNGAPLAGQTNLTLSFPSLAPTNAGSYYAVVTNASLSLSATSAVSTVTVYTSPVILGVSPQTYGNTITLFRGAQAGFALTSVTGFSPFYYQWYTNGVPDVSGTSTNYSVTNVQAGLTSCACVVTNSAGSATNTWTLSVIAAPTNPYPAAVLHDNPLGYWRLNESDNGSGNNGAIANDYWGGNFGIYSNTILIQTNYSRGLAAGYGNPSLATDTNETSAEFGYYPIYNASGAGTSNCFVGNIQGINFAAPTNTSGAFSIEAWAKGDAAQYFGAAGIVAKGAWGAEQFTLDIGGATNGSGTYAYRFTYRIGGSGSPFYLTSNTNLTDGNWHHLVGVLNEPQSNACFYVDGIQVVSDSCSPCNGVLNTSVPVSIGSRQTTGSTVYGQTFMGDINDVAIYNYPLTSTQVVTHYLAAGIVPRITLQPPAVSATNEGTTLTIPAQAIGTLPLNCQWYDITSGSPGTAIPGQTSPTLAMPNISATYSNHTFALTVTNIYGQTTSTGVLVSVSAGVPKNVTVTPATLPTMYAGLQVVFTATAQGAQPFHYQWSVGGSPVGVTTSTYTNTVAVGGPYTIGCTVTNTFGIGSPNPAYGASVTGVAAPTDSYGRRILSDQPLAFWRLDEASGVGSGNPGGTANDYVGGHNGTYYQAVTGLGGFSPSDPSETSTGFGMNDVFNYSVVVENDLSGSGIPNIDFSQQGINPHFSVEAWVNAPPGEPNSAGIVAKGYGGGGEQFCLDIYSSQFRFFVHDSTGRTPGAYSGAIVPDGNWHHLVGVCDEGNSLLSLYVDGALTEATTMVTGQGLLGTTYVSQGPAVLTGIGSRDASVTDSSYTNQLSNAEVDDVALYNYALTPSQVTAHYSAAAEPANITVQPSPDALELYQGLSVTYSATAEGSPPLSYQWQKNGASMSGQTTNTLTFASLVPANTGSYDLVVTNAGRAVTSSVVTLTVLTPTTPYQSLMVAASPLHYWHLNETNGSTAYDCIGGLNGTYGATTTLGQPGVSDPPFYGFPSNNFAVAMDAGDATAGEGYVTAPALNLNTNTVTIIAWVYPFANISTYDGIVFVRTGTDVAGLIYAALPTRPNTIGYTWNQGSSSTYDWGNGPATPVGQWSFVALVIEPTQTIAYVGTNGVLASAANAVANNAEAWSGTTLIGADTASLTSRIFNGELDEVAVFDYALSPAQIAQLYSTATAPPTVTLTLQWSGPNLILSWPQGTLLQAPTVNGPWTPVSGAAPPSYTVTPSGAGMFYRVQVY
ncbi:MAG: LamG-like jellyroll fold domain-containing protein [Verrucomicrobiota bacterium]|jgi:hypothetical protein